MRHEISAVKINRELEMFKVVEDRCQDAGFSSAQAELRTRGVLQLLETNLVWCQNGELFTHDNSFLKRCVAS